jgi:hypothetical protein
VAASAKRGEQRARDEAANDPTDERGEGCAHEAVLDDLAELLAKQRDVRLGRLSGAHGVGRGLPVECAHLELDGERNPVRSCTHAPVDDRDVDVKAGIAARRGRERDGAELRRPHRRRGRPQGNEAPGKRERGAGEREEAGEENGTPGHRDHRSYRRFPALSSEKFPKERDPLKRRAGDYP